jgi:hypothetical protein
LLIMFIISLSGQMGVLLLSLVKLAFIVFIS